MNGDCPGCGGRPQAFLYELRETFDLSHDRFEVELSCEEGSAASVGLSGGETERRVGKSEALAPARPQRNHTTSGGEPWPHTITKR